jgi:hypothetical protein
MKIEHTIKNEIQKLVNMFVFLVIILSISNTTVMTDHYKQSLANFKTNSPNFQKMHLT